ncbi:MAG TPA: flagellar basal body-associated FliL family protein [Campylobacterales bacterium]|nr:flagellar basal body-associated FliL family protein [Campylobacterales bacterium]
MIRKILFISLFIYASAFAEVYEVLNFQSDIFSKKGNNLKKVTLSLRIEGRDLQENDYKITDALNIIISSFYLEDLFTSKGKEKFKNSLSQYLEKKYSVEADTIYLKKFKITPSSLEVEDFIEALKAEGCCHKQNLVKKVFDTIEQ